MIVAAEFGADLDDLVACRLSDLRTATRSGDCTILGRVWLERTYLHDERLMIHSAPVNWIRRGAVGVVVIDWRMGCEELQDVRAILADSESLAVCLRSTLASLDHFPTIDFVRRDG